MSAIGGIYRLDDRRVNPEWLASLGAGLDSRGPDGGREVVCGPVGMIYRAYHTNRDSRHESQPLVSRDRHILVCDLRVDNRTKLITQLRNELMSDRFLITDAAIIMAAYRKWGISFLPMIIGEFALSLYDPHSRTLVLARDHIGARTLYFHANKDRVIWSSEIGLLIDTSEIELEVEDEFVAGHLTLGPELGITPYKNVHAVKPAHFAIVSADGRVVEKRFWGLDPTRKIYYKHDNEYEEHCKYLLWEAVSGPLKRADGPIFAELSGGVDSSSIVCVADTLLHNGEAGGSKLQTLSYVYDESPTSDERKFIGYVEAHRGRKGLHLREVDYRFLLPFEDESRITVLHPIIFSTEFYRGLSEVMKVNGARVILSGHGGDEIMCSDATRAPELSDLLVTGKLWQLHNRTKIWGAEFRKPYLQLLWEQAFLPASPRWMQVRFKREPSLIIPPWFNSSFAKRMNLRERMTVRKDAFGFSMPSNRHQATCYQQIVKNISAGFRREISHIEVSYPYLHRPLVEFMQAIPFEQRVRPSETRSLLRRTLKNVLPPEIVKRMDKGSTAEIVSRALVREMPRLRRMLEDAYVYDRGYVRRDELLTALSRARHGCEKRTAPLLLTISLEFWLRAFEQRRTSVRRSALPAFDPVFQSTAVQMKTSSVAVH